MQLSVSKVPRELRPDLARRWVGMLVTGEQDVQGGRW